MYFHGANMGSGTGGHEAPTPSVSELDLNKDQLDFDGYKARGGFLHTEDYKKVVAMAREAYADKKSVTSSAEGGANDRSQLVRGLNAMSRRAGRDFFKRLDQVPYMYDALDQALRKNPQLGSSYDKKTLTDQKLLTEAVLILGGAGSLEYIDDLKDAYRKGAIK